MTENDPVDQVPGRAVPLPGMEEYSAEQHPHGEPQYLELAVRRTIARLDDLGYLDEMHSAHTAAAIELAQIITSKHHTGKMSTVGNDMRAMIDLLDRLVPVRDDSIDARLKAAVEQWTKALGTF